MFKFYNRNLVRKANSVTVMVKVFRVITRRMANKIKMWELI